MSFVRNLYADLIEKRLWPVALALLVALVAIPVLIAKPAGESTSPAVPPADNALLGADSAALIGETKSVVTLGSDGGFRKSVERLERKNPFVQQAQDRAAKTAEGATVEGGDTSGAGTGTGTSPVDTPGSTAPSGGEQPIKLYEWAAKVKFGKVDETKAKTVSPGEFMPSENNPVLLFLGADESGKKAMFLVSAEATARGDGTCVPSESNCQIVKLGKGDIQFFEVALSAETIVTYELELTDIALEEVKDANVAERNAEFLEGLTKSKLRQIREAMRTKRVFKALDELGF
jgi:hypothetical protein